MSTEADGRAAPAAAASKRGARLLSAVLALLAFAGAWWVLKRVGPSQHGNFLAFLGSLVLVLPSLRQMWANLPYSQAAKTRPRADALREIQVQLANLQIVNFVRFSWFDAAAYTAGALLLAAGFIIQVLGWTLPV